MQYNSLPNTEFPTACHTLSLLVPLPLSAGRASYTYGLPTIRNSPVIFGVSIFVKNEQGDIFHTYTTYHRGTELLMGAFNGLDLTPKGRNEANGTMSWIRLHDEY